MADTAPLSSNATAAAPDAAAPAAAGVAGNGTPSGLFTTLLVAQIRNQNPLEPTDPSEFVAQLTQLSQMEALNQLTAQGTAQGAMLQGLQAATLGGQVGSNVSVASEQVLLGAQPVTGSFELAATSAKTTLLLTGADGVQHGVPLGSQAPGRVAFTLDAARLGLAPGVYRLGLQSDGHEAPPISLEGSLDGVRFSASGGVLLEVSSAGTVAADALAGFNGRPAPTAR